MVAVFDENNYTSNLEMDKVTDELKNIAEQELVIMQHANRNSTDDELEEDEEKKYSAVLGTGNYKNVKISRNNKNKQPE